MQELTLEIMKVDRISQRKRLLYYYYVFSKMQENSMDELRDDFEKLLNDTDNWMKYYQDFFGNNSIDDEEECVETYRIITGNKDTSSQNFLINTWQKVKNIIEKEVDCEKKLFDILNEKAENHPIISKIIIVILMGILSGLVEGCIQDAIQNSKVQDETQAAIIYITDGEHYKKIFFDGNEIVIKDIEQNEER